MVGLNLQIVLPIEYDPYSQQYMRICIKYAFSWCGVLNEKEKKHLQWHLSGMIYVISFAQLFKHVSYLQLITSGII